MSKIQVNDIKPTGAELFDDSENFLNELSNDDMEQVMGGQLIALYPTPPCTFPPIPFPIDPGPFIPGPFPPRPLPYSPAIL